MPKTIKIYIAIFFLLMIAFVVNDATQEKPVDWNPSFLISSKEPYGIHVFNSELKNIFHESDVEYIQTTPYEYFSKKIKNEKFIDRDSVVSNSDEDDSRFYTINDTLNSPIDGNSENAIEIDTSPFQPNDTLFTYFFVDYFVAIDPSSVENLLDFVKEGNTVWISSFEIPIDLKDTLGIETEHIILPEINIKDSLKLDNFNLIEQKASLYFANKTLDSRSYSYDKGMDHYFFKKLDSTTTTVLGYQKFDKEEKINFVKVKFGNGNFFFHTQPFVFTNYNLLKTKNSQYVLNSLSYLNQNILIFDDRNTAQSMITSSPLRYILSQPALKWAFFVSLFGLLLFMIFRAKRQQRVIPIINKLPNTSIEFAKTIGNLYYQEGKPQDIVNKKITFFLEHLRNTYLLDTQNLNDDFIKKLYAKSGVALIDTERLIKYITKLSNQKEISESSLVLLKNMIDNFYNKTIK